MSFINLFRSSNASVPMLLETSTTNHKSSCVFFGQPSPVEAKKDIYMVKQNNVRHLDSSALPKTEFYRQPKETLIYLKLATIY